MANKTTHNLEMMRDITRRNNDRDREYVERTWMEQHLRERLTKIRAKDIPAAVEPVRQEIAERYEHDLSTW